MFSPPGQGLRIGRQKWALDSTRQGTPVAARCCPSQTTPRVAPLCLVPGQAGRSHPPARSAPSAHVAKHASTYCARPFINGLGHVLLRTACDP